MTQTQTIQPGTQVAHSTEDDLTIGEVVESDTWYDKLQLRGVAASDQVLVAWTTSSDTDAPVMLWAATDDLQLVTTR